MSFTYDVATRTGTIRLIINDKTQTGALFSDEELQAFLLLENDNILRASAQALDTIASNQAMVLKRIVILDMQTDGISVAVALREHAKQLRLQADRLDIEDTPFDIAEWAVDGFTYGEKLFRGEEWS